MSYLDQEDADRIVTAKEYALLSPIIEANSLAIRCNKGSDYQGGAGYNLSTDGYAGNVEYATALYAAVCFSQDTIVDGIDAYNLLLMRDCALGGGEVYIYRQSGENYETLPKSGALGLEALIVYEWPMNDSAIDLSRKVVERILAL